jgi:hypothetical protein
MNEKTKKSKYEILNAVILEVNTQIEIAIDNLDFSHKITMQKLKEDLINLRDGFNK